MKTAETILTRRYNEMLLLTTSVTQTKSQNITTSSQNDENIIKSSSKSSKCPPKKPIDQLLGICLVDKPPVPRDVNKMSSWTLEQELGYYATTSTSKQTFDSYWDTYQNKLPLLAALIRRLCSSTASSVASEASFSSANYIQRKQRSSLSPSNLCYSMLLRDADLVRELNAKY
jgi:hypothetical protein